MKKDAIGRQDNSFRSRLSESIFYTLYEMGCFDELHGRKVTRIRTHDA